MKQKPAPKKLDLNRSTVRIFIKTRIAAGYPTESRVASGCTVTLRCSVY
jgi:hypothetical protein